MRKVLTQKQHKINEEITGGIFYEFLIKDNYFASINISLTTNNNKFWKTVKRLILDKMSHKETINFENDAILSDD